MNPRIQIIALGKVCLHVLDTDRGRRYVHANLAGVVQLVAGLVRVGVPEGVRGPGTWFEIVHFSIAFSWIV